MERTEVVTLDAAVAPQAADVLARAFLEDPAFLFILQDQAERAADLRWFMGRVTSYCDLFGQGHVTPGVVEAAAVWLPPGQWEMTPERAARSGFDRMREALGEEAFRRMIAVGSFMDEHHHRQADPPHWYLWFLGVDPPRQGRGVGGDIIRAGLERVDESGFACYLETANPRNIPFYQRHGFQVAFEGDVPGGGPHMWMMQRPPAA